MERMVHKTWLRNPHTDLAFFYTLSKGHLEEYRNGQLPRAAAFHEQVAIHYGIPTIGLAHAVAEKLEDGEIEWNQFAHDAVHPHAGGYRFYNETFQHVLPTLFSSGAPGPRTLRDPLTPDLQVYPPPVEVVPQDIAPFKDTEGNAFTGPEGNALYSGGTQGITLGFSGIEVAVLVFVAPETGRYVYRFGADQLNTWKNEDTDFALNVVHFPWGEDRGDSQMFYRAKRREAGPFTREGELHLTAGEELAFIVGTDTPRHVRGGWQDFWLQIGYFETPDLISND